jgi:hypothetical protein
MYITVASENTSLKYKRANYMYSNVMVQLCYSGSCPSLCLSACIRYGHVQSAEVHSCCSLSLHERVICIRDISTSEVMQPTLGWPGFQHSARSLQLSAKSDAEKYLRDYAKLAADVLQMAAWSLGETPPNTEGDENNSSCANLDFSNRLLSPNTASLRLQKHELCGALRILIPNLIPISNLI